MKIVERDGKKFLECTTPEDEKAVQEFLSVMAGAKPLRQACLDALDEREKADKKLEIAGKRFDLWKAENHDRAWEPVQAALKAILPEGANMPVITHNGETGEFTLDEAVSKRPPARELIGLLKQLDGAVTRLAKKRGAKEATEETEHENCAECPTLDECPLPKAEDERARRQREGQA